jgi:16S rRNA (cytosine967-C5)-methyltransferase
MIAPARVAAFNILSAVSSGRIDLPSAIVSARATLADDRDRALATEIATGVQRWRGAIDHVIADVARRPIRKLDREIVEILRIGIYQLLHLERVPAAAVVDDAVDLARRAGKKSAAGFVNAVLRTVSRRRRQLPLPARPGAEAPRRAQIEYLTIALSHPQWLVERWLDRLGFDATERWLQFDNTAAPLTVRANRLRMSPDELARRLADAGVRVHPARYAPGAFVVDEGNPLRDEGAASLFASGAFVVQDEASQLVALLANARPGMQVFDACASPGGKTTAMAAAMEGRGRLVAADVRDRRIQLLRTTVALSGAPNVEIVQADLLQPLPFSRRFDLVLVDAPCSGLGTLRRDPDIKWRRGADDLPALAAAQLTMLQHAADAVAPGGRLVYATCSSEPEENEGVVDAFLLTTPGFQPLAARDASGAVPESVVDGRGHLRTEPHRHGLEAFFGAVMQRTL